MSGGGYLLPTRRCLSQMSNCSIILLMFYKKYLEFVCDVEEENEKKNVILKRIERSFIYVKSFSIVDGYSKAVRPLPPTIKGESCKIYLHSKVRFTCWKISLR